MGICGDKEAYGKRFAGGGAQKLSFAQIKYEMLLDIQKDMSSGQLAIQIWS